VRMIDESGQEVLPTEFLAAAERTDLMKNIDRWIVGAAMSFCAAKQPYRVFVRLSRDSMHDQTLGTWLQQQLKASGVEPSRIVFEITEEMAREKPREARSLQGLLSALGIEFAVEPFGSTGHAAALLHRLAVHQDHAGPAVAGVAAPVGAGEAEDLADVVDQEHAGPKVRRYVVAVYGHADRHSLQPSCVWAARAQACRRTRRVSSSARCRL